MARLHEDGYWTWLERKNSCRSVLLCLFNVIIFNGILCKFAEDPIRSHGEKRIKKPLGFNCSLVWMIYNPIKSTNR